MDVDEICLKLRNLLEISVERNPAEGILLSGGLDTSIVATLASRFGELKAFTVAFEEAPSPDVEYARQMAERLGLVHTVHSLSMKEL